VSSSSFRGLLSAGKESRTSFGEANNELHVKDVNKFEDNSVVDDDAFPNVHVDDQGIYLQVKRRNVKLITVFLICMRSRLSCLPGHMVN
jgi:hypothetical protein